MTAPMTAEECRVAIEGLKPQLERYADLIVRKGVAVHEGQEVVVEGPVERADFVRIVVKKAYEAGAGHVTVIWGDDAITRLGYEYVDTSYFEHTPAWKALQLNSLAENGAAFIMLIGDDPAALKGIDPAKPATSSKAFARDCRTFRDGMDYGRNTWSVAGVACEAWAKHVFPELSPDEAVYRLWLSILQTARATGEDPQQDWETHNAAFEKNKRILNDYAFDRIHYTSSNGTDLTVGLNPGHVWEGGSGRTVGGTVFFPNIPTEEVFTTPNRMRVDGIVYSALPLAHAGQLVTDFWLRFEDGAVVDYDAAQGKDVLRHILETDENAVRLGECALISKNTPIRQLGILFYNTLYDENASCHLALGLGFPECVEGGLEMTKEELLAHGVNQSDTHVDFMIGADDLCVTGITLAGEEIAVFTDGQWDWENE